MYWKEKKVKRAIVVVLVFASCVVSAFAGGTQEKKSAQAAPTPSAVSYNTTSSCQAGATKLTFWGWVPGFSRMVVLFNRTHPNVCVDMENVGAGTGEYDKLITAFKAGSGAPDVAEVEYSELPTFEITKSLLDLSSYGAGKYESDHVPGMWSQVTRGDSIYGMPFDAGPVALLYNAKLFSHYGLAVPETWDQFAADAAKLHQENPKARITNFWPVDAQFLFSMMSQTGARPFGWNGGDGVTINVTCPKCMEFASYWQKLIDADEVTMVPDVQAQEYGLLDSGLVASVPRAAWGPKYFAPAASKSVGDWRVTTLPQWSAGEHVTPSWGGSAYVVTKQTKYPEQATEFVGWLSSTLASWRIAITPPTQDFPSMPAAQNLASFRDRTIPLTGSQKIEQPFIESAPDMKTIEWLPFMTYVSSKASDIFGKVAEHKGTMASALTELQKDLVSYAEDQGFKVTQ